MNSNRFEAALVNGFRSALIEHRVFLPEGHFALDTEYHAARFFQSELALVTPEIRAAAASFIAGKIPAGVEVLVAPPGSGVALAPLVAVLLSARPFYGAPLLSYASALGGTIAFLPAFQRIMAGRKAAIIEWFLDERNNGTALAEAASRAGAEVLAVVAAWNAGPAQETLQKVPIRAAIEEEFELFLADNCPLCRSGQPVDAEHGAGPEFVEARLALAP